ERAGLAGLDFFAQAVKPLPRHHQAAEERHRILALLRLSRILLPGPLLGIFQRPNRGLAIGRALASKTALRDQKRAFEALQPFLIIIVAQGHPCLQLDQRLQEPSVLLEAGSDSPRVGIGNRAPVGCQTRIEELRLRLPGGLLDLVPDPSLHPFAVELSRLVFILCQLRTGRHVAEKRCELLGLRFYVVRCRLVVPSGFYGRHQSVQPGSLILQEIWHCEIELDRRPFLHDDLRARDRARPAHSLLHYCHCPPSAYYLVQALQVASRRVSVHEYRVVSLLPRVLEPYLS